MTNNILKKITSYFLVVSLVFTVIFSVFSADIKAASYPTGYPNTYENIGAGANDIVAVAKTQIGYQENSAGTKYGYWYNKTFVNQPWCAMFVSWCAEKANISQSVLKKYASCSVEVSWFKSIDRWHDSKYYGGSYTPKKGDIVFYRDKGSSSISTHTGILAGLNGNYLDVIEGNATNGKVCHFTANSSRTLTNSYVIGYGSPDYMTSIQDEPDTYECWQVNDTLSLRKSYSTSSKKYTTIPVGATINVTEFELTEDYLWGHTNYNGYAGWCALDYCDYIYGNIDGTYYQLPPTVSPSKKTLYLGETKKLTTTNSLGAKFTSSNTDVATVNKKGKITAISSGTSKIKCKTAVGSVSCKVTVKNPYFRDTSVSTCIGDKIALHIIGANDTVTWKSSNKSIAKVNSEGKVTGVAKGTATITAAVSGVELKCRVNVTKYPTTYENFTVKTNIYLKASYQGTKNVVKVPKGTAIKVTEVKYSNTYTWGKTSCNGKSGWIILNNCKYNNGSINGKTYKVKPYLTETTKKIYLKNKYTLNVKSASGEIKYASKNKSIAKVNSKGVVTAQKAGTTYVTAVNGSTTLKCKIKVLNPVLSKSNAELLKGNKTTLTVKGGNSAITWKSSKDSVAKVDSEGVVTAKGYGRAKITAVRNGVIMKCTITVYDPVLSPEKAKLNVGNKKTLKVKQYSGAAVKWSSSKESVAKVSSKGKVTAKKAGKATISAVVDGATATCKITVK